MSQMETENKSARRLVSVCGPRRTCHTEYDPLTSNIIECTPPTQPLQRKMCDRGRLFPKEKRKLGIMVTRRKRLLPQLHESPRPCDLQIVRATFRGEVLTKSPSTTLANQAQPQRPCPRKLAKSWRSRATRTKTGAKKGHVHEVGHNMHIPNVRI